MAKKKTCLTCEHEPVWEYQKFPNPEYNRFRGQCRFRFKSKTIKDHKIPQGGIYNPPYIDKDKPKQTCTAWVERG